MPELPEVETIVRGLASGLESQRLRDCILNRPDMRFPFPDDLQEILIGAHIKKVSRRAKYLLFTLDNNFTVIAHLGMSGTMRVMPASDYIPKKHDHVLWELENEQYFVFNDPRRFGFMLLSATDTLQAHPMLAKLGPEPLSKAFSPEYLQKALSTRRSAIKVALMDAALVVGVGNIYASEALFRARVNPLTPAKATLGQSQALVCSIQEVLKDAIASGGSTLRDYVRSDGDSGYFQHSFTVYGRANQPCNRCETPIRQTKQAGRSTYFCQKCQGVE